MFDGIAFERSPRTAPPHLNRGRRALVLTVALNKRKFTEYLSPVNVVPEEEIVGLRWVSQLVEVSEEILILAVYVSNNVHWSLQLQQHWLLQEDFASH